MSGVVAVVNQKGGVGKTTTAVNVAAGVSLTKRRTLLIDADPQSNATRALGFELDPDRPSIYDGINGLCTIQELALPCEGLPFLSVVPSTPDLVGVEVELVDRPEREFRLKKLIAGAREEYDHILIDCPPSLGLVTLNALAAADAVLIPVQAEYLALEGISQLMGTIEQIREVLNPELAINGIVMTMFDERTNLARQVVEEVRSVFGDQVYKTVIPRNVRLSEAPSHGQAIYAYDIRSRGAEAYFYLSKEFIEHEAQGTRSRAESLIPSAPATRRPPAKPKTAATQAPAAPTSEPTPEPRSGLMQLDLDRIQPNNEQPRRAFDQATLEELASSMQSDGVLQPIVVRPIGDKRYEIIAGERRWRAAQIAGLLKVPALVREVEDNRVLELALIENIQREDLNPLEVAAAYRSLIDDLGLTQQEVADRVGKQRATVANMVRLLELPKGVRQRVLEGSVAVGHAKVLASVPSSELQTKLADRIARDGLTVRALEKLIKRATEAQPRPPTKTSARDPNVVAAEESLQSALGTKVSVHQGKQGGSIELHFFSNEEMERIYDLLMKIAR